MVGNLGPDNSGRIYVEFDYNNLIVVDPNKTIDAVGNIRERLVDHENLVMYANLEADVLPRTKLAVGISPEDSGLTTISVAKMNFLKPTKNNYLGTGYYDELTGKNVTKFDGSNQPAELGQQTGNGAKPYIQNTVANELNVMDNGLLGITSINITTNTSFIPSVTMVLEDVQGKALFQLGNNSPYSAFFNLPYPPFYLTLKGFYGQAVRYQLNLEKFHASFNGTSGNYQVNLTFKGYKFNILNEIAMGHLVATPHMYSQRFNFGVTPVTPQQSNKANESQSKTQGAIGANNPNSSDAVVTELVTERGYQKIVEVYSEYKAKGLIAPELPELTLVQLMAKLETFEQNIMNSFDKAEVESLTNIKNYKGILTQFFTNVRGGRSSWFNTYLNPQPLILKNGQKVYKFKSIDEGAKTTAISLLQGNIKKYNDSLGENPTLGIKGKSPIPNPIKYDLMIANDITESPVDWNATTIAQTGNPTPTKETIDKVISSYGFSKVLNVTEENGKESYVDNKEPYYIFEGDGRFDATISSLETQANKKLSEYEAKITAELLRKIEDKDTGIGFKPTVRNIIAVIMASAEAFVRLLDDVHTKAWNVKYDPVRKGAILDNPSSAPSSETVDNVVYASGSLLGNTEAENAQIPVYPWPQFFVESPEDKKGRFQLKYIADPTVVGRTQGNNYSKWPEVEFVEEYMKGLTQKFQNPLAPAPVENQRDTNIININAIEFPSLGIAYANKEEIKFFYEIWERQFLTSHYSGLVRANLNQINDLIKLNIETEVNNIKDSLGVSSPYITFKLKNYGFNSTSYPVFLNNISNMGTGRAYQDYIRDFFVTPYIRALTDNPFSILKTSDLGKIPQVSTTSDALRALITNASNEPLVVDTLPYTDATWNLNNLNQSATAVGNQVYETKKSLTIFEPRKIISNFTDIYNYTTNRPVTNFSYLLSQNPSVSAALSGVFTGSIPGLTSFYKLRLPKNFAPTEGYCNGVTPTKFLGPRTTTSMLNTPYFINAIQSGVNSFKNKETYPYVQAAYLFLNSLPLATLREKYKSVSEGNPPTELDYIASCFNKFGAIHKIPYAWILKYGSIYHRYKKHRESGIDILTNVWRDFDYTNNYNPITNQTTTPYTFNYNKEVRNVVLQSETDTNINMQIGFYPKLINDFNVFYNGYDLYSGYTNNEIQESVTGGMKMYNFLGSNINSAKQGNKNLRLNTWSVLLPDSTFEDEANCNPKNNTKDTNYFVVPSFGTPFNQTVESCFTGSTTSLGTLVNITSNSSVFNGSVRCLWSASNYGYFDSTQIAFPNPDSYLTRINTGDEQSPVHFLNVDEYSKIEEMFSVFDKKILDSFEQEFLNFCKPITNNDNGVEDVTYGQSPVNINNNFRNFQSLFKTLMTVPKQVDGTGENDYFDIVVNKQWEVFQSGVKSFMEYDMIIRNGNPSNYNRRVFDSYLSFNASPQVVDPITFNPYVRGSLPTKGGGVTVTQSKIANRQAWFALETEVGFSTIPNVAYSSNGSYITDFFVDNNIEFTAQNVALLSKIIKMYATQKLIQPTISVAQFKNQISQYLNREEELQNNFLNGVLTGLNRALPSQQQLPQQQPIQSSISGEQSKVENYEIFKALNDKWVAGGDYTNKTLFEDMMFLDRASRNIGDTILVDIFDLKSMFGVGGTPGEYSLNQAMSVYTFISGILIKNNFNVMNLPAYVNFYNVQDVDGTTTPRTEGSLDFADSLWGTYLDVDYRKSGPKMVCFYAGKPSQYLDLPKGNFKFRNDGFEMRRASENPLLEDQKDKKDWAVSNKCVGFTVDLGIRNQNIFYSFSVSQDNGAATSEAINTQLNMVDQASGRQTATQNNSLYNLYKQRSYKCSVTSLGNALIQPTMYFNLRHVPMFNGPYMIQDVQHSIQAGNFQTTFTGVRQGVFDLPAIDSFLQSINQNLVTKLEELLKINKDTVTVTGTTNTVKSNKLPQKADNTLDTTNACSSNVLKTYSDAAFGDSVVGVATPLTPQQLADALIKEIPNNKELQVIIYCLSYMRSFQKSSNSDIGAFNGWNNNFATISLDTDWGGLNTTLTKRYSCIKSKTNPTTSASLPVVHFDNIEKYVRFMSGRLGPRVSQILEIGLAKYYVCFWPESNISPDYYDSHTSEFKQTKDTLYQALTSAVKVGLSSLENSKDLKTDIKLTELKGVNKTSGTSGISGTSGTSSLSNTSGTSSLTQTIQGNINRILEAIASGDYCPPPTIKSFSPLAGYDGTIVQINGDSLGTTNSIKLAGVEVPAKDITVFSGSTVRFIVPKIFDGQTNLNGRIEVKTDNGSVTGSTLFNYNPALKGVSSLSPGGATDTTVIQTASSTPSPSNPIGTNTNPQNTEPITLIETANVEGPDGSTLLLTVRVNPEAGDWKIDTQPSYNNQIYSLVPGDNNKYVARKFSSISGFAGRLGAGYVTQDQQEFSITKEQMVSAIKLLNEDEPNLKAYNVIRLYVRPVDRVANPQDVILTYNFNTFLTNLKVGDPVVDEPSKVTSITYLGDVNSITQNGPQYYNIVKPGGGFKSFQLNVPTYNAQDLLNQEVVNNNNQKVSATFREGSDTKYTYSCTVNSLGTFKLKIGYRVNGVPTTIYGPPFTL
jgi:hypothetical protein